MESTITRAIMEKAKYFEGFIPEEWNLLGIYNNGVNYLRYYQDSDGNYRYTRQKIKKDPAKIVLWRDEEGQEFAQRVYPKRKKRQGMM